MGEELSLPPTMLGLGITLFGLGRLAADIPAGRFADRVAFGPMTIFSGALTAVGAVMLAGAAGLAMFLAGLTVMGIASSTINTVGMTYFSTAVPTSRRGASLGLYSAAILGGQALGPMFGGFVDAASGWRASMLAAAGVGAVLAAVGAVIHRRWRVPPPEAGAPLPVRAATADSGVFVPLSRAERAVLNAVPFGIFFMLGAVLQTLVPIIGSNSLALSPAAIGVALGVGGLCRFLGAVAGAVVSDRVSRNAALLPGLCLAGVGVAILGIGSSYALWIAAIMILSVSSYGVAVAATILADRTPPGQTGRQMGRYRVYGDFGMMVGPLTATAVFDRFGQRPAAFGVAALIGTIAAAAVVVLHRPSE